MKAGIYSFFIIFLQTEVHWRNKMIPIVNDANPKETMENDNFFWTTEKIQMFPHFQKTKDNDYVSI